MKIRLAKKIIKEGFITYYKRHIYRKMVARNIYPYWELQSYIRDHRITKAISLTRKRGKHETKN